jgi:hypothetical protein
MHRVPRETAKYFHLMSLNFGAGMAKYNNVESPVYPIFAQPEGNGDGPLYSSLVIS